jgi:hypothetical protein
VLTQSLQTLQTLFLVLDRTSLAKDNTNTNTNIKTAIKTATTTVTDTDSSRSRSRSSSSSTLCTPHQDILDDILDDRLAYVAD